MSNITKIGITHGDFNGVGYEVIIKTLQDDRMLELFTPVIYGSQQIFNYYRKLLGVNKDFSFNIIKSAKDACEGRFNLVEVNTNGSDLIVQCGIAHPNAGKFAAKALLEAQRDLHDKHIDAVVTAPINKEVIQSEQFRFNGHTDFFGDPYKADYKPIMLFTQDSLRVALFTTHMPYSAVPQMLTQETLEQFILSLEETMKQDFGIAKPRMAVLGLNPHAGENGLLGREEIEIIEPVIKRVWESGRLVFGPFPADGFWGSGNYKHFDVTIAMYHDQGLLPFKLLAMDQGVNITSGLPIIRTSPDHGTAYDIAGKGVANETSFRNAIYRAIDIFKARENHKEATHNPLKVKYVERGKDNVKLDLTRSEDEDLL